jgi:alpha-1,6-mannosyltransferase
VLLLIALTHNHLPWRRMPAEDTVDGAAPTDEQPSPPPTPPVKPDAYAESP